MRGLPSQLPFLKNDKQEIMIDKEVIFGQPGIRGFSCEMLFLPKEIYGGLNNEPGGRSGFFIR